MASLDVAPEVSRSYQKIVSGPALTNPSPTYAQWAIFSVSAPLQNAFVQSSTKASVLKVQASGEGELEELIENEFNDGRVQFAFVKIKDPNTALPKLVLICWCGEGVPERVKGYFTGHLNTVTKILHGYHVQVTARSESDLSPEAIIQKVADASGAKYSSSSTPAPAPPPKPVVAAKPVFQPTRTTGGSVPLPVGNRAPAPFKRDTKTDADGWGEDAPQVTRSQLEKVASAYQPTKVDINQLRSQPTSTTSGFSNTRREPEEETEVVKGGYQPIGKIDIAALRRGYKEERPEPVKGAYTPIDVQNIKKPQPVREPVREPEAERPKPVAERSSAFNQNSQSERLTSLPKPTVAKKFGTGAPSFGTKPITPNEYGFSPKQPSGPVVGSINKTGSTRSPAQLWAEKKARERGLSGASETTPPTVSPAVTDQHLTPSYTGTSASSQPQEDQIPRTGGINALKDRFSGAAPMGAPTISPARTGGAPPPLPAASRPQEPPREPEREVEPIRIPSPPVQQRSPSPPTPEVPGSPVRLVRPIARSDSPEPELVTKPENPVTSIPTESLSQVVPREEDLQDEEEQHAAHQSAGGPAGGLRAAVLYDYAKDEDNEINLVEGQVVTEIETVDENWWSGRNANGESGLFPSNYVELIGEDAEEQAPPQEQATRASAPSPEPRSPSPPPQAEAPAQDSGRKAVAIYDYTAAEDNEISFPEDAVIENVQFPDEEWWQGTYKGQEGLFPANYVELQQ